MLKHFLKGHQKSHYFLTLSGNTVHWGNTRTIIMYNLCAYNYVLELLFCVQPPSAAEGRGAGHWNSAMLSFTFSYLCPLNIGGGGSPLPKYIGGTIIALSPWAGAPGCTHILLWTLHWHPFYHFTTRWPFSLLQKGPFYVAMYSAGIIERMVAWQKIQFPVRIVLQTSHFGNSSARLGQFSCFFLTHWTHESTFKATHLCGEVTFCYYQSITEILSEDSPIGAYLNKLEYN